MKDNQTSMEMARVRQGLDAAMHLYQTGRLLEAVEVLQPLIKTPDRDGLPKRSQAQPFELIGRILHDLGRPFQAADAIEKASLVAPISDAARIVLASCYAELQRIDLARELYLQLALSRRLSPELMLQVAAGLEAIDSPQLAMQVCEWVIEMNNSLPQAYYDMGSYAIRSGQPLYMAEALTKRALQLDPANLHFRFGLVSLLIQLNRDVEAIESLGDLAPAQIDQVTCIQCLNRVAGLLGRFDQLGLSTFCEKRAEQLRQQRTTSNGRVRRGVKP